MGAWIHFLVGGGLSVRFEQNMILERSGSECGMVSNLYISEIPLTGVFGVVES